MAQNQHFLAQIYLHQFTDPSCPDGYQPYLWLLDTVTKEVKRKAPKKVAAERGFNDWETLPSAAPQLEHLYGHFEGKINRIIKCLEQGDYNLATSDRFILAVYIALQLTRTPQFRGACQNSVKLPKDLVMAISVKAAFTHIGEMVFSRAWNFFRAPQKSAFLTTDQPVSLLTPDAQPRRIDFSVEARNPDVQINFILSPRLVLLAHQLDDKSRIIDMTPGQVEACNHSMLRAAHRWVFCSTKDLAEWARDQDVSKPPKEKVVIYQDLDLLS
jgi:hypothetical protein